MAQAIDEEAGEAGQLLRRALSGELEPDGAAKLSSIPPTPELTQYFETKLNTHLCVQSKTATTGMQAAHPDYHGLAKRFLAADRALGVGPWQSAMRDWARRERDRIFAMPWKHHWEDLAEGALSWYLGDVDRADEKYRQAKSWLDSLSPEEADKQILELLGKVAGVYINLTDAQVEQLNVVAPTADRVAFFESKLRELLENEFQNIEWNWQNSYICHVLGKDRPVTTPEAEALRATPECRQFVESNLQDPKTHALVVWAIAEHIKKLDDLLNPHTWQLVLRNWAKRRAAELARAGANLIADKLALTALIRFNELLAALSRFNKQT